jgi:hypothetical protein
MIRTQIHLDAEVVALLDREIERSGASRSELIRRAVRERYGGGEPEPYAVRLERAMSSAFGAWKNRKFESGEEYVRALRSGDWDVIDG